VNEKALAAQIEVAVRRFNEQEDLRLEKEKLAADLETRKLMDRAKAILMKRANLPEDEAHRRLQQESQKRRISMAELCRRIIESDELMGP
jgi:response regulator NasT